MEHWEDGTPNPDGKKLRKKAKQLMLGTMYGMGAKLMSENLGVSMDEAKKILEEFAKMFPKIKEFTQFNEKSAHEIGYVEDYMGRRRHLEDAMLPELEIRAKKEIFTNADILMDCEHEDIKVEIPDEELSRQWEERWQEFANSKRYNAKKEFKELAKKNDIDVYDNGAFISKTMTQCTNARIQGSAATLTKKAMVAIANDPLMKKYDFRILIPVHDELLGECKSEYIEEASERLSYLMVQAALPECSVKMKCDAYAVKHWYADEVFNQISTTYRQLLKGDEKKGVAPLSSEEAIIKLTSEYPELKIETIKQMCEGTFDVLSEEI